jgi:integrase
MASISTDKSGNRIVQFIAADGKRRSIRLGNVGMEDAREVKRNVEAILSAAALGQSLRGEQIRWLRALDEKIHKKLAGVGLVEPRKAAIRAGSLGEFLADYIAKRAGKARTVVNRKAGAAKLTAYFGEDAPLGSITAGMADDWLVWLKGKYANATTGRAVKYAKEFFRYACRRQLIEANPFTDLKSPAQRNEERKVMVSIEDAYKIIGACPDAEWRLIVALARFGGLRVPSEIYALEWTDILWDEERFVVRSPKTGDRIVPIFPELRPYLDACWDAAGEKQRHVIAANRPTNPGTRMRKIIRRAGLAAYPKPFHNLRASRQTELAAEFPLHVVCAWLGNTEEVAKVHYLKVRESDFQKALQKAVQQTATNGDEPRQTIIASSDISRENAKNAVEMGKCEVSYYARRESNPQPMVPKTIALSS